MNKLGFSNILCHNNIISGTVSCRNMLSGLIAYGCEMESEE